MIFVVLLFLPAALVLGCMHEISLNVFNFDLMAQLYEYSDMIDMWLSEHYDEIVQAENFLMNTQEYFMDFFEKF